MSTKNDRYRYGAEEPDDELKEMMTSLIAAGYPLEFVSRAVLIPVYYLKRFAVDQNLRIPDHRSSLFYVIKDGRADNDFNAGPRLWKMLQEAKKGTKINEQK